jgi:hypothetical protein
VTSIIGWILSLSGVDVLVMGALFSGMIFGVWRARYDWRRMNAELERMHRASFDGRLIGGGL